MRKTTLPCGHTFDYVNLYNEIKSKYYFYKVEYNNIGLNCIKCPYCRHVHDGVLPYHDIKDIKRLRGINQPNNRIIKIHKCNWVYQSGKNKGLPCSCGANMYQDGSYCEKHHKIILNRKKDSENKDLNIMRCQAVLKSGKNKGMLCNCKVHDKGHHYCKKHRKQN